MNTKFNSQLQQSLSSKLCRTLCVLLIVAILATLTISGVYALYVNSNNSSNAAGVAGVGVEIFNLVEHGQAVAGVDYSNVVPGVDIPGPHIQLKIKSEVSYTLYVVVKVSNLPTYINADGEEVQAIYFDLTSDWELVQTVETDGTTAYTYKYVVSTIDGEKNYVFTAGKQHTYLNDNEIAILQNDVIYVSEKYGELCRNGEDTSFSVKFETYIQQVI